MERTWAALFGEALGFEDESTLLQRPKSKFPYVGMLLGDEASDRRRTSSCDWQCYLDRYPGLASAFGATNVIAAQAHYQTTGIVEGRDCTWALVVEDGGLHNEGVGAPIKDVVKLGVT